MKIYLITCPCGFPCNSIVVTFLFNDFLGFPCCKHAQGNGLVLTYIIYHQKGGKKKKKT